MPSRRPERSASSMVARRRSGYPLALAAGLVAPALFAMACVTVNIYFPAPEVREAAEKIVDETWGAATPPAPGKQSSLPVRLPPKSTSTCPRRRFAR
jgi:hypothetical protein